MSDTNFHCEYCDSDSTPVEKLVTLTRIHDDQVYVFENVPATVCPNCGHRYFDGPLILELEKMMRDRPANARPLEAYAIQLPVSP